jgi:ketosteroid isomerase-like protein
MTHGYRPILRTTMPTLHSHFRRTILLGLLVSWSSVSVAGQPQRSMTEIVSRMYLEVDQSMNYDLLETLYAPDVTFFDPTGEVFDGEVAKGVIQGAGLVTDVQRGWGLREVHFSPEKSFFSGEYALHRGTYVAKFEGSEVWVRIPFVTVHKVVNGKIQSRRDFGEYVDSFGLGSKFDAATDSTKDIAGRYLQAYLSEDFRQQKAMMSDDVIFQDPTAAVFGPELGRKFTNARDLLASREQVFASISDFDFDVEKSFVSYHHAVYMGEINYTDASGSQYRQPAVFIIEVRNGLVSRHWDYVDYSVGPMAKETER